MGNGRVPSRDECLALLKRYEVPENVIRHSFTVCAVGLVLCRELQGTGLVLDSDRIQAAGLLHDIAKAESLGTGKNHSQIGAEWLFRLGFDEVAEIVRQHVVLDDAQQLDAISEVHVVHYADKRVKHAQVVSLADRFVDLRKRYGKTPDHRAWLERLEEQNRRLEALIFRRLAVSPEFLNSIHCDGDPAADWLRFGFPTQRFPSPE